MKKMLVLFVIPWHILAWSDFRGTPCGESAASSSTNILWSYDEDESGFITNISAEANFDPEKSWTITSNLYVLKHEQGHMDIAKIICDRVFKEVNPSKKYTQKQWLHLKFQYEAMWTRLDDRYDEQTRHSTDRQMQEKWNGWFDEKIKK